MKWLCGSLPELCSPNGAIKYPITSPALLYYEATCLAWPQSTGNFPLFFFVPSPPHKGLGASLQRLTYYHDQADTEMHDAHSP